MLAVLIVAIMLLVCIAMPLAFAWRLWRLDEPTRAGWLVVVADTMVFALLILLVGRWDMAGMWARLVLTVLLLAAVLVSLRRHRGRPWRDPEVAPFWRRHVGRVGSLALFGAALVYVLTGLLDRDAPRSMAFPMEEGLFVVAHGGSNSLLNHHHSHRAQLHAADITAVGPAGLRTFGLLPDDPARYVVFGKPVISPCDGLVTAVEDGLPDLTPPNTDRDHPAGNHVILLCDGLQVELAHFRRGSIVVRPGARVATGDRLGEVGNSGNSTEPHLHIHAVDPATGAGVQLAFDGVIPTRNALYPR